MNLIDFTFYYAILPTYLRSKSWLFYLYRNYLVRYTSVSQKELKINLIIVLTPISCIFIIKKGGVSFLYLYFTFIYLARIYTISQYQSFSCYAISLSLSSHDSCPQDMQLSMNKYYKLIMD